MQKNSDNFSIQDVMNLAKTPAGQQLIDIMKQSDPQRIRKAADLAAAGNLGQAKQMLSDLLADPEVQTLLSKLGR